MVYIAQKSDFNKDFDSYLNKRLDKKTPNFFFKAVESLIPTSKGKKNTSNTYDVVRPKPKKSFLSIIFKKFYSNTSNSYDDFENYDDADEEITEIEEEIETVDEAVEELEEKRDSLLRRLFKSLFGIKSKSAEEDIDEDLIAQNIPSPDAELKDETKKVLKSLHRWISKLPPEHIESFRRSQDFIDYKDILDKYGILKKD
ncbi:MAG: hypothetical protein PHU51_02270 [Candidatus Nanoarchaeia archaeon]|nr:hypothetical protein [Candidatus Nanoarchaeia archaeon]